MIHTHLYIDDHMYFLRLEKKTKSEEDDEKYLNEKMLLMMKHMHIILCIEEYRKTCPLFFLLLHI